MFKNMYDQSSRLDELACEITRTHSLMGFLLDYFGKADPDLTFFICRYGMYTDMATVIHSMLYDLKNETEELSKEIFEQWKVIKGLDT